MNKQLLMCILFGVFVCSMPFVLLLGSFSSVGFDLDFYDEQFSLNGAYDALGEEKVKLTASYLVDYLRYDKSTHLPTIDLYTHEENVHMYEVKFHMQRALTFFDVLVVFIVLFVVLMYIFYGTLGIVDVARGMIYGGALTIFGVLFFGIAIGLFFDPLFILFHEIIFTGQWMFPSASSMITMFPETFFFLITIRILMWAVGYALFCVCIGLIAKRLLMDEMYQ